MNGSYQHYAIPAAKLIENINDRKNKDWIVGVVFAIPSWLCSILVLIATFSGLVEFTPKFFFNIIIAIAYGIPGFMYFFFPKFLMLIRPRSRVVKIIGFILYSLLVEILFIFLPLSFLFLLIKINSSLSFERSPNTNVPEILLIIWGLLLFYQSLEFGVLYLVTKPWKKKAIAPAGTPALPFS